jgi:hypothetical protein
VRRSQRAVATARRMSVLSLPFLASAWQANPTQVPQLMHAGRPPYGTELMSIGTASAASPSASAPRASKDCVAFEGSGGIG